MTGSRSWQTLAVVLLVALATGCGGTDREPRQVIVLMLDAARPDRFSSYGYERQTTPHMDRLAEGGVVFTEHFAQGTHTRASLPPLFYSRYFLNPLFPTSPRIPLQHPSLLFRVDDSESISMPRAFEAAGFRSAAISAHIWLKEGTRFAGEIGELHDLSATLDYDRKYAYPRAEDVIDETLRWWKKHRKEDFFLYVHLMDTHFPHFLDEDARDFLGADSYNGDRFHHDGQVKDREVPFSPEDRAYLDALYDGSLRYTDRHIGRLLDELEKRQQLERTAILVTSDHGEHLLETPPRFDHGGPWFDAVARVPLILYYPPRIEPAVYRELTESVDVMPTLLGLMDVRLPPGKRADGIDLSRLLSGNVPAREHAFAPRAIRSTQHKAFFQQRDPRLLGADPPPCEELSGTLYDLAADPREIDDVWQSQPDVACQLFLAYRERLQGPYERYIGSTTTAQPTAPFAVAANHFEVSPEAPSVSADLTPAEWSQQDTPSGWLSVRHFERYGLLAPGGGPPIQIEIAIPDGEYALSAAVGGEFRMQIADGPELRLAGPPHKAYRGTEEITLGKIIVTDQRFRATVTPGVGPGWSVFRRLGFVPLGGGVESTLDPEHEKRLEALGYID